MAAIPLAVFILVMRQVVYLVYRYASIIGNLDLTGQAASFLGSYEYDTVTGTHTIDRCRPTFQDGNAFYVLRIDVVDTGTGIQPASTVTAIVSYGGVIHRDTIDHDERLIASERGIASDKDTLGCTDSSTRLGNLDSGQFSLQGVSHVELGSLGKASGLYILDSISERFLLTLDTQCGDDDFIQRLQIRIHLDGRHLANGNHLGHKTNTRENHVGGAGH